MVDSSDARLQHGVGIARWPNPATVAGASMVAAASFAAALGGVGRFDSGVRSIVIVIVGVMLAVWLVVAATRPAWGVALWVMAFANMLPLVDTQWVRLKGVARAEDFLVLALLLLLPFCRFLRGTRPQPVPWWRSPRLLSAIAAGWWAIVLLRTVVAADVPFVAAVAYGRDLLYVPLVLVTVTGLLQSRLEALRAIRLLALLSAIWAGLYVLSELMGVDPAWVSHPYQVSEATGGTRLYVWGHLVVATMVPVAFWEAGAAPGFRRVAWMLGALLLSLQVLMSLWRANYLAVGIALTITLAIGLSLPNRGAALRANAWARRVLLVISIAAFLVGLLGSGAIDSMLRSIGFAVEHRVRTFVGWVQGEDVQNYEYRVTLTRQLLVVLDGDWLWGMGYLHPAYRPIPSLPFGGAIRNTDVSASMIFMPMGFIGLAVYVWLYVSAGLSVLLGLRARQGGLDGSRRLGLSGALIVAVVGGVTLVYWSWPVTAAICAICVSAGRRYLPRAERVGDRLPGTTPTIVESRACGEV